jgi:hypothetical protein
VFYKTIGKIWQINKGGTMSDKLKLTDKYFEISIDKDSNHPLSRIGVVYVVAKNREAAVKMVDEIDPIDQAKFHVFRNKFLSLRDDALTLSDQAIENGFELIGRTERIKCFREALLRVYLSNVEDEALGFIRWMIITLTSDIIEVRSNEKLKK